MNPKSTSNANLSSMRGRGQAEHALQQALQSGVGALGQQVRYLLALCQVGNAKSKVVPPPQADSLSMMEARLSLLSRVIPVLSPAEQTRAFSEIAQIDQNALRLSLTIQVLPHLRASFDIGTIQTLLAEVRRLPDAATKARLLTQLITALPQITIQTDGVSETLSGALNEARRMKGADSRVRSMIALAPYFTPFDGAFESLVRYVLDDIETSHNDALIANAIAAMSQYFHAPLLERAYQVATGILSAGERARAFTAMVRHQTQDDRLHRAVLDAVGRIPQEEERANALIAYAPFLEPAREEAEFPPRLQKALSLAIGLTRKLAQARALVALAPYLTPDLQGEALAAVNGLESEEDRALLLAELAPNLPERMLVAALAVAQNLREPDARAHALTVFATVVPAHIRAQTLLDALAAASHLDKHYERVRALMTLVEVLPANLREQAYLNALDTARMIENESAKARTMALLGAHLPANMVGRAHEIALQIGDMEHRLNALLGIVGRLAGTSKREVLAEMMECAVEMPFDYKRARAVTNLIPHLSEAQVPRLLTIIESIEEPFDRIMAYLEAMPLVPEDERSRWVEAAWKLLELVDDGYSFSIVLSNLAPYANAERKFDLIHRAFQLVHQIDDEYDKASAIVLLAPLLAKGEVIRRPELPHVLELSKEAISLVLTVTEQSARVALVDALVPIWNSLSPEDAYALWVYGVTAMTQLPMADTLLILSVLMPVLERLNPNNPKENLARDIAQMLGLR